jgi:hypothetical protein
MVGGEEEAAGPGVGQHVRQLLGAVGRVDHHQGQACEAGSEFEQHPFGRIAGPHGHRLAGLEAREQGPGCALGLGEQFAVPPLPPAGRIRAAGDEGDPIGRLLGGTAQYTADGGLQDRLRGVGRPVGSRQREVSHRRSPPLRCAVSNP